MNRWPSHTGRAPSGLKKAAGLWRRKSVNKLLLHFDRLYSWWDGCPMCWLLWPHSQLIWYHITLCLALTHYDAFDIFQPKAYQVISMKWIPCTFWYVPHDTQQGKDRATKRKSRLPGVRSSSAWVWVICSAEPEDEWSRTGLCTTGYPEECSRNLS